MYFRTTPYIGAAATNPAINTVLATSGAVNEGGPAGTFVNAQFILANGAALPSSFKIQIWNGTTEVTAFTIMVPANDTKTPTLLGNLTLANGNHVRILNNAAITGTVQAVIFLGVVGSF